MIGNLLEVEDREEGRAALPTLSCPFEVLYEDREDMVVWYGGVWRR
jgi:hypothetical protein